MRKLLAVLLLVAAPAFGQAPAVPQGFLYVTDAQGHSVSTLAAYSGSTASLRGASLVSKAASGASTQVFHLSGTSFTCASIPSTTPSYRGNGAATTVTISGSTLAQLWTFSSKCSNLTLVGSDGTVNIPPAGISVVKLVHKDGTETVYAPTANTDAARWTALTTANTAALSGDRLVAGPGTFQSTSNVNLTFNSNLAGVYGAGAKLTIFKATTQSTTSCAFVPASNQEFANIDFEGTSQTDIGNGLVGNQPFGNHTGDTAATNINVHDCIIGGAVDGHFVKNDSACTGTFRNCDFVTEFDSVRLQVATGGPTPAHLFDFYSCSFTQAGSNGSSKRGVVVTMGKARCFMCNLFSDDGSEGSPGSHQAIGYSSQGANATIEVYGGKVKCANGSSNIELQQASSGTLLVSGATGSGTNGAFQGVSGSPTYQQAAGIVLSGTAGSTLNVGTGGTLGTAAYISSTAGGDLSGTLPSPTVAKINGSTPSSQFLTTVTSTAQRCYVLQLAPTAVISPAASTTYYFGAGGTLIAATDSLRDVAVPVAGTVIAASLNIQAAAYGTNETSTISLRKNDTSDTTISSAVATNAAFTANASGLSVAVAVGDGLQMKWVTPAWGTPPTTVKISGTVVIAY